MLVECLAVVILIAVFIVMAYRRGARRAALLCLPLLCLPAVHIVFAPFASQISAWIPHVGAELFVVGIDLLGLAAACLLLGVGAFRIPTRRGKRNYLLLCGGFSLIFCLLLIKNILQPFLPV